MMVSAVEGRSRTLAQSVDCQHCHTLSYNPVSLIKGHKLASLRPRLRPHDYSSDSGIIH